MRIGTIVVPLLLATALCGCDTAQQDRSQASTASNAASAAQPAAEAAASEAEQARKSAGSALSEAIKTAEELHYI